jgi:hypothetical protein
MPGQRAKEGATYVTRRAPYRTVLAVDAAGVVDPSIPILDTGAGGQSTVGLSNGDTNQYGKDARILVAVIPSGFTNITLQLWLRAPVDQEYLRDADSSSSSSSGSSLPATDEWVLAEQKTGISSPVLWVAKDIPPGEYKIVMSAATGSGYAILREQHAT